MMDKWLIKLIYPFRGLLQKQGVDMDSLLAIVETKLMMDKRRGVHAMAAKTAERENRNHLTLVLRAPTCFVRHFYAVAMVIINALPSFLLV